MMNYANDTHLHRQHSNVQCNCRQCKQFDYADTAVLPPLGQPPRLVAVELVRTIDSETWERHSYYMPTSRPYNKYQRD